MQIDDPSCFCGFRFGCQVPSMIRPVSFDFILYFSLILIGLSSAGLTESADPNETFCSTFEGPHFVYTHRSAWWLKYTNMYGKCYADNKCRWKYLNFRVVELKQFPDGHCPYTVSAFKPHLDQHWMPSNLTCTRHWTPSNLPLTKNGRLQISQAPALDAFKSHMDQHWIPFNHT